jgi:alkanesulfonate monooxygenase
MLDTGLKVFATCPPSFAATPQSYLREVLEVARWSEGAGCEGILIYTDNGLVDPWLIAQAMITHTERLCPLVAVQPVYMHPYTVAKMVASLGFLHGRRMYLNIVAGGFKNDLEALNDPTPHDERYTRLVEYTKLIMDLLSGPGPVTLNGRYYKVANVKMTPPLKPDLVPGVFVSGSSEAGLAAARDLGALAVRYPKPVGSTRRLLRRTRRRWGSGSGSSRVKKRPTRGRWPGHGSPKTGEASSRISWR